MIKTDNFTSLEKISLAAEIGLVAPTDTPLYSLLLAKGQVDQATAPVVVWREKTLDTTSDVSVAEGANPVFYQSNRAEISNYCEIFLKGVEISGSAQASTIAGIPDLMASEVADRLAEMKVAIEKALINGVKNDGSQTPFIRRMGGLISFVPAENKVSGTSLDEANFKATVKKLWENGLGINEYVALVNADLKEAIDAIYDAKYQYIAPMQDQYFGLVVRRVQTNYGNVNVILNRHMPTDKMVVFDPAYLRIANLREPVFEPLAKTGDSVKGQVVAELTLKVLSPKAVAMFELSE